MHGGMLAKPEVSLNTVLSPAKYLGGCHPLIHCVLLCWMLRMQEMNRTRSQGIRGSRVGRAAGRGQMCKCDFNTVKSVPQSSGATVSWEQ